MISKRFTKALVEVERYDGLWKLVKVATKNVGGIVHSKARPIQAFAISVWGIEGDLELFDALF